MPMNALADIDLQGGIDFLVVTTIHLYMTLVVEIVVTDHPKTGV